MKGIVLLDRYVIDVLMRDLCAHDRRPSAYLLYLHLWSRTHGMGQPTTRASLNDLVGATGLSRSAVQAAVRALGRRKLIKTRRLSQTAVPEYKVYRPWRRYSIG